MIDTEGNFDEEFVPTTILGEGYEDYDGLHNIKTISQLTKFAADNHRALSKKQENVIQKPAEDADDETKTAYKEQLKEAMGIPSGEAEYEFPDVEGRKYQDGDKEFWGHTFKELNVSKDQADGLLKAFVEKTGADTEASQTTANEMAEKIMKEDVEAFDKMYPGEQKPEALRHVITAIEQFGTDTLKKMVKDGNLFDNHDLAKWADMMPLANLPFLVNVGKKAANTTMPAGEATMSDSGLASIASANGTTVDEIKQAIANYPNSWKTMYKMPA